jgi:plastocyanin domain-containing protein
MKQKYIVPIAIIISALIVAWAIMSGGNNAAPNKNTGGGTGTQENVSIVDGKQIISLTAKGGYSPRKTIARANTPTTIKMTTNGTFDCSTSLVIPDLNYKKNLPFTGETLIDVPPQKEGTVLRGLCGMGMYSFEIDFN